MWVLRPHAVCATARSVDKEGARAGFENGKRHHTSPRREENDGRQMKEGVLPHS